MRRWRGSRGFTIVEVLVVVTIISILAAIAIPLYLSQQGKARNTVAETSARGAMEYLQGKYMVGDSSSDEFPSTAKVLCEHTAEQETSYKWALPSAPGDCAECESSATVECSSTLGLSKGSSEIGLEIKEGQIAEVCVKNAPGSNKYYCAYQNNKGEGTKPAGSKFCVFETQAEAEAPLAESCTEWK